MKFTNIARINLASLLLAAAFSPVHPARSDVIAYWPFEPGDPGADLSGNGHHLLVSGIVSMADVATNAPGANSAVFDGFSSFAQTENPLDMSPFPVFTVEWFMRTYQGDLGVLWELSADFNDGDGFISFINQEVPGRWWWAMKTDASLSQQFAAFPQDGEWHHYAVSIDTRITNNSARMEMWLDGILQTTAVGGIGTGGPAASHPFYIGARSGSALFFNGQLDELRISDSRLTPDQFLIQLTYPDAQITIVNPPADATLTEGGAFHGTVEISTTDIPEAAVLFQWEIRPAGADQWTPIPGAVKSTYDTGALELTDNGTQYRVIVRAPGGTPVASAPATITVLPMLDITLGLVGHYPLDAHANDLSPAANNGVEIGGPTYVTGKIGQAISLDGYSQYVKAGDPGLTGAGPKSVSLWFSKQDTALNRGALSFGAETEAGLFEVLLHSGVVAGHFWGGIFDTIAGGPNYTPNEWHHAVITYDGATVRVFYDGQPANSKTLPLNTAAGELFIGTGQVEAGFTGFAYFDGQVDDVGLWNRALSANEINKIYTAGLEGKNLMQASGIPTGLAISFSDGQISVTWTTGYLQSAAALDGEWTDVPGATSPHTFTPTGSQLFFRLRQ
ncbi:MAG TPA: LamG domain-containing protein [Verrucomicrobiota bacterium]|nr:LamG domain-containing protein [Verrucomicrobiota bacterium]HNT14273.1 LamG domain-containing protein [Verrucomicrobiota bacterium]